MKWLSKRWVLGSLLLTVLAVLCWFFFSPRQVNAAPLIRIEGAYDLKPLAETAIKEFNRTSPIKAQFFPSTTSLQDLKSGGVDAIFLGRDVGFTEGGAWEDHVVAYDAVCILVDEKTYLGGEKVGGFMVMGGSGITTQSQATIKYDGLNNLSMDEVRGFMGHVFGFSNDTWKFSGPRSGYYTFEPYIDDNGQAVPDPDNPKSYLGNWVWNDVQLSGEGLQPGMFDTQAALLQKLGIPESVLTNTRTGFFHPAYDSEELLISHSFIWKRVNNDDSGQAFRFYLGIASRRVTVSAIRHKFELRALSINGVDPLSDPQVIYSGEYPLSRRVHLLLRQPYSASTGLFARFLESPQGQKLVSDLDFLPVSHGAAQDLEQ